MRLVLFWIVCAILVCASACGDRPDGRATDAKVPPDSAAPAVADARPALDAPPAPASLDDLRNTLFVENTALGQGADTCQRWDSLDASQRAVFLTITHRLYHSLTPDGASMLHHIDYLYAILGGGADGTECGGTENNRLFMAMDAYLWDLAVQTSTGAGVVGDGGGGVWRPSSDLAGPHAPFDASDETESGLSCLVLIELPGSRPPTAQVHFFRAGSEVPVQRGPNIDLPADPHMMEIDLDFDCLHRSNPLCPGSDFAQKYLDEYGDFECAWLPLACAPAGPGCYPAAALD